MLLDIFVPQNRERDVLALEFALDHCPVRFGLAAMALLRPGVLVQLGFEDRVGEVVRQRPGQPGLRKSLYGLTDRRRREPCSSCLETPTEQRRKISRTWRIETLPAGIHPLLGPSQKADPMQSQRRLPPSRAALSRNHGRELIGMLGGN